MSKGWISKKVKTELQDDSFKAKVLTGVLLVGHAEL